MNKKYNFYNLVDIVEKLRSENGCPWDREQTHKSIRNAVLEEAYEVVDAIDNEDNENLCEELGDLILHSVFHSQIAKEFQEFDIDDVTDKICRKMIYRHPHIFSDCSVNNSEEVLKNWEELKKKEKNLKTETEVLKNVTKALPSLTRAYKIQSKASNVGFDFQNINDVFSKMYEELDEFCEASKQGNDIDMEEELGDFLFSIVNISRFLKINPEFALTKSIEKFINRFEHIEKALILDNKSFSDTSIEELDVLWNEAKKSKI